MVKGFAICKLSKCTRKAIMPILAAEALLRENKKSPVKNVTSSGNKTQASHNL